MISPAAGGLPQGAPAARSRCQPPYHSELRRQLQTAGGLRRAAPRGPTRANCRSGHLDTATLLAFLEHLEADRRNGVRTRNARLAAIKSFFRYLEFRHPECLDLAAQVHALPQKKCDLPPVDYLDHAEIRALLDAPATGTVTGLRDRAMLCLAYNAGLRVSELVGLALEDLKAPGLDSIRVMGKGRRGARPTRCGRKPAPRCATGSVSGRMAPTGISSSMPSAPA